MLLTARTYKGETMAYQIERANKRDHAQRKARQGMRVVNKSIFTIVGAQVTRAEKNKGRR